jgi:hypothetical protein
MQYGLSTRVAIRMLSVDMDEWGNRPTHAHPRDITVIVHKLPLEGLQVQLEYVVVN